MPPRFVHVPMPFSTSGSSVTTVVRHLVAFDRDTGGNPAVILSRERDVRVEAADNHYVSYSSVCPRQWISRRELMFDHLSGALGVSRPYTGRIFRPAAEELTNVAPDAVVVHEGHYATGGLREWRRRWSGPLILYVHTPISRAYLAHELAALLNLASHIVFVSDALRVQTLDRVRRLATPTSIIHNAVDHGVFHPRGRTAANKALRVTYAGQVAEHKGVMELLTACTHLDVPLAITVVGSAAHQAGLPLTAYERDLRALAGSHVLPVKFIPYVSQNELADILRDTDVACVPSLWEEPFGMIALEAMASGAAVVASTAGGLPEACDGAATLVNPRDTDAFAAALDHLVDPDALAVAQERSLQRSKRADWTSAISTLRNVVAQLSPQ